MSAAQPSLAALKDIRSKRNTLMAEAAGRGVALRPPMISLLSTEMLRRSDTEIANLSEDELLQRFPGTVQHEHTVFALPMFPTLTNEQQERVIDTVVQLGREIFNS